MADQVALVGNTLGKQRHIGALLRLNHAYDLQFDAVRDAVLHEFGVIGHVGPGTLFFVLLVGFAGSQDTEGHSQGVFVGEIHMLFGNRGILAFQDVAEHGLERRGIINIEAVEGVVGDFPVARKDEQGLVIGIGPLACHHFHLAADKVFVIDHLLENARRSRTHRE